MSTRFASRPHPLYSKHATAAPTATGAALVGAGPGALLGAGLGAIGGGAIGGAHGLLRSPTIEDDPEEGRLGRAGQGAIRGAGKGGLGGAAIGGLAGGGLSAIIAKLMQNHQRGQRAIPVKTGSAIVHRVKQARARQASRFVAVSLPAPDNPQRRKLAQQLRQGAPLLTAVARAYPAYTPTRRLKLAYVLCEHAARTVKQAEVYAADAAPSNKPRVTRSQSKIHSWHNRPKDLFKAATGL